MKTLYVIGIEGGEVYGAGETVDEAINEATHYAPRWRALGRIYTTTEAVAIDAIEQTGQLEHPTHWELLRPAVGFWYVTDAGVEQLATQMRGILRGDPDGFVLTRESMQDEIAKLEEDFDGTSAECEISPFSTISGNPEFVSLRVSGFEFVVDE